MKRLGLSILLSLIALVVAGGIWISVSWQDVAAEPDFWEDEIIAFEAADAIAPPEKGLVLFTGSSSIRFWTSLTEDMERFYAHLESALHKTRFIIPQHQGKVLDKLRRFFNRSRPERTELNMLRGILSSIDETVANLSADKTSDKQQDKGSDQ